MKDEPKTSDDYIVYATEWLSGDSGWRPEHVEEFMKEFRELVRNELKEEYLGFNTAKKMADD